MKNFFKIFIFIILFLVSSKTMFAQRGISFSTNIIDFGNVAVDSVVTQDIIATNTGNSDVTIYLRCNYISLLYSHRVYDYRQFINYVVTGQQYYLSS